MAYILLSVFVFHFLMERMEQFLISKLKSAKNVNDYRDIRNRLYRLRWTLFIVFYTLLISQAVCNVAESWRNHNCSYDFTTSSVIGLAFTVIYFPILFRYRGIYNILAPLSNKSINEVVSSNEPYILYLRSFSRDTQLAGNIKSDSFSESTFITITSSYINTYAIGCPLEMATPEGVERLYIDGNNWKNDVFKLIKHATAVICVLGNSEACRWELRQIVHLKKDYVVIVDDFASYYNCIKRESFAQEWLDLANNQEIPFIISHSNGDTNISEIKSGKRIAIHVLKMISTMKRYGFCSARRPKATMIACSIVAVLLSFAMSIIVSSMIEYQNLEPFTFVVVSGLGIGLFITIVVFFTVARRKTKFAKSLRKKKKTTHVHVSPFPQENPILSDNELKQYFPSLVDQISVITKKASGRKKIVFLSSPFFKFIILLLLGILILSSSAMNLIIDPVISLYRTTVWDKESVYILKMNNDRYMAYYKTNAGITIISSLSKRSAQNPQVITCDIKPNGLQLVTAYINPKDKKTAYIPIFEHCSSGYRIYSDFVTLFLFFVSILAFFQNMADKKQADNCTVSQH